MRIPIIKRYSAVGKTSVDGKIVIPVNYLQIGFAVSLAILLSQDAANGASTVQFTYDDLSDDWLRPVTISQATTVITVTDPDLPNRGGVAIGDAARIIGTRNAGVDGEWLVATTPSPTSYTLTSSVSQTFVSSDARIGIYRLLNSPIVSAANARAQGVLMPNYTFNGTVAVFNSGNVTGVALNVTALTAGSIYMQLLQGLGH